MRGTTSSGELSCARPSATGADSIAEMTAALGAQKINQEQLSRLMQSHSLTVCKMFPNAFLSNAKHEALHRRGRRPARPRPGTDADGQMQITDTMRWLSPPPGLAPIEADAIEEEF